MSLVHRAHLPHRIHQGIASGQLTKDEVGQLRNQRRDLHTTRTQALEDGQISKEEKQSIRGKVRQMSHDTFALKHNGDKR